MDLLPERISPIRFYRLIETLFHEGGIDEEGEAEKRAWIWNYVRGTSSASFSSPFTFCHVISLNIVTIYLENKISDIIWRMRRSLKKQKDNEFHFTYLSSFSIGKKKNNRSKRRRGPFRSWCNLRNDKRWKKVSYNARCSPERTSLIFCLF